jgi:hypothetical protein
LHISVSVLVGATSAWLVGVLNAGRVGKGVGVSAGVGGCVGTGVIVGSAACVSATVVKARATAVSCMAKISGVGSAAGLQALATIITIVAIV